MAVLLLLLLIGVVLLVGVVVMGITIEGHKVVVFVLSTEVVEWMSIDTL